LKKDIADPRREYDYLAEMFRILESQAPAKQTATDTISTLSSRLQSATLLEDRRGAILGLRSFAKVYPASVASGALRGLISSLNNDAGDVDTIKVVLETLLMLFNPHEASVGVAAVKRQHNQDKQNKASGIADRR